MDKSQAAIKVLDRTLVGNGCWEWQGGVREGGYGQVDIDGQNRRTHRVVYEHFVGIIPEGMELDHLCRVRRCVRPDHLQSVTRKENLHRGAGLGGILYRHKTVDGVVLSVSTRPCRTCDKPMVLRDVADVRGKRYCSHSCLWSRNKRGRN